MSEQSVGFLLEFINKASPELEKAHADFTKAMDALEDAVDAAQAAFTFLEEGTGQLAKTVSTASDLVTKKTGQLRDAIQSAGNVEVVAPNTDPITAAMQDLGENIKAPIESGVEEAEDTLDDLGDNTKAMVAPTPEQWIAYNEALKDVPETVDEVVQSTQENETASVAYTKSLNDMSNQALETRSRLLGAFTGLDATLAKTGKILFKSILPNMKEFGDRGKEAAAIIAGDTVAAYDDLQQSASQFFQDNAKAFSEANDTASVWSGFLATDNPQIEKVQDLLRIADKTSLKPLVQGLVDELGDAALDDAFWAPIAANKNVDREFFDEMQKQFAQDKKIPKSWYGNLTESAKKLFWDVFRKQGEKSTEGIGLFFVRKLKSLFSSPIGQFVAALQISQILTRVLGPALNSLQDIIGHELLPLMEIFSDFMDEAIRPAIHALVQSIEPLLDAFGKVMRSLGQALLPVFEALATVLKILTPVIVTVVQIVGFALNLVMSTLGNILLSVAKGLDIVVQGFKNLFAPLTSVLKPIIPFVKKLDEMFHLSEIAGLALTIFLAPALVGLAATAIPAAITGIGGYITAMTTKIGITKAAAIGVWNLGRSILGNLIPGLWGESVAAEASAESTGIMAGVMDGGLFPALVAATIATWNFTIALLANPLTWIVLAIIAAIAVLGLVIYALWDPIQQIFDAFASFFEPVIDWVKSVIDWFGGLKTGILIALGPLGLLIAAVEWLTELFSWLFSSGDDSENTFSLDWITEGIDWLTNWLFGWFDMIPGWIKWLFGLDDTANQPDTQAQEQAGVQEATSMVEGAQEGAESTVSDQPDWLKSMWDVDSDATKEVADSASKNAGQIGQSSTEGLEGRGDNSLLGNMEEIGFLSGMFMLEGLAAGMFLVATAFPLSSIFSLMFGPFAGAIAQPAQTGNTNQVPMSGISVGKVDYDVDADLTGEEFSDPVVKEIRNQTRTLEDALSKGSGLIDLDLQDLKDLTEF